jgi:SHS2 domain-containing protein
MMTDRGFGFTEIEHTADWALKVWAPDLALLFAQAAEGMYWLMETQLSTGQRVERVIEAGGMDPESQLVYFLSELLYLGESEGLGFDQFEITFEADSLRAVVGGAPVMAQKKEIKAVTYHNLAIRQEGQRYTVVIVFDV